MNEIEITSQDETESEATPTDELTESSENLFLRNLSEIIANSERNSVLKDDVESLLSIEDGKSVVQPQFGYFLPLSLTPQLRRSKRFARNIIRLFFCFASFLRIFRRALAILKFL